MKSERQSLIGKLVKTREVCTQGELTRLLSEAGYKVTQATVSRDIHELRLVKSLAEGGGLRYGVPQEREEDGAFETARFRRAIKDGVLSMDYAGNSLVIRTFPGMAMSVGASVDALDFPEILGSVSGVDMVLCVIKEEGMAEGLMEKLRQC